MLGDELHKILYYNHPKLIVKWAQLCAHTYDHYEDSTGIRMQIVMNKNNSFGEGPYFSSDCGFAKYLFFEYEVEEITISLQRFINLKAFL